jgi:UDP-glucose 4-epimerase
MTVLVTGGKGFIGARVIRNLVERGEDVVCMEPKASAGRLGALAERITMVEGDIVNHADIAGILEKHRIDRIAHMVFFSAEERGVSARPESAGELYRQQMIMNTGTFHIFEAARLAGIKRLIFPSSVQYHGFPWHGPEPVTEDSPPHPTNSYGIGKQLCEHLAQEYNRVFGMEIVSVRIPGVYGPGVRIGARGVNLIGTAGALGDKVTFPYAPDQTVVLAHVDDIAEMIARAMFAPSLPHTVYHVGGHYVSYAEIAEIGRKLIPDMQVSFSDKTSGKAYRIDCSLMEKELGVHHRSLLEGYRELMNLTRAEVELVPVAAP